jgi:hypothetical protein
MPKFIKIFHFFFIKSDHLFRRVIQRLFFWTIREEICLDQPLGGFGMFRIDRTSDIG